MKIPALFIIAFIGLGAIALVFYVLRPPEEASAPVEAVPLAIEATVAPAVLAPTEAGSAAEGENETIEPEPESAGSKAGSEAQPPAEIGAFSNEGLVVFVISQDESTVRFSIDEILRGSPATAIGVTDQVAGELAVDFDAPANTQIGVITINARTLATDNSNRNRMIQNEILDTAEHEFITFSPTAIAGLPERIPLGGTVTFQVSGDLTIRDVTVEQTFEINASVDESGRLQGHGITTVLRSDYGILIPSVPSVASVSDEVILEIDFVAYEK